MARKNKRRRKRQPRESSRNIASKAQLVGQPCSQPKMVPRVKLSKAPRITERPIKEARQKEEPRVPPAPPPPRRSTDVKNYPIQQPTHENVADDMLDIEKKLFDRNTTITKTQAEFIMLWNRFFKTEWKRPVVTKAHLPELNKQFAIRHGKTILLNNGYLSEFKAHLFELKGDNLIKSEDVETILGSLDTHRFAKVTICRI